MDEAVMQNLQEWLENPYWASYYKEAPSENCKHYIALELYASDTDSDEAWKLMDDLEPKLTLEDWQHLLKYSSVGPGRAKILRKIEELEKA